MAVALKDVFSLSFNEFKKFCNSKIGRYGIIYSFKSPSEKMYVGQTTSDRFSKRMSSHKNSNECPAFNNAIKKYGWNTVVDGFRLLAFTRNLSSLDALEIKFIKQYHSFKNGYNCTEGGGGMRGFKQSLETREKMSKVHKERLKYNPEALRKFKEMSRKHLKIYNASEAGKEALKKATKKANAARRKPIIATNLQTGERTQYASAVDAERKLRALHKKKFQTRSISKCANKKRKTHYGHTFEFALKNSA